MSEITAELPADGRPMEGRSVADSTPIRPRSHSRLGRLKLKTVADLDGRTRAARRARAVVAELVKALGGPDAVSPGQRQACERAGMLTAIAEDLAARQLAGLPVTLDEVLRAGVARRSVQASPRAQAYRKAGPSHCPRSLGRTGRRQGSTSQEGFRS